MHFLDFKNKYQTYCTYCPLREIQKQIKVKTSLTTYWQMQILSNMTQMWDKDIKKDKLVRSVDTH